VQAANVQIQKFEDPQKAKRLEEFLAVWKITYKENDSENTLSAAVVIVRC